MGVVEIVAVEGEQAGAAGQGDGPVAGRADAAFARGESGVAQSGITESFHQLFQVGSVAVVVHHQRLPGITTLGQAAGQGCSQLRRAVAGRDQKADGGRRGHRWADLPLHHPTRRAGIDHRHRRSA